MGMEPLYDISAGLALGYNGSTNNTVPLNQMDVRILGLDGIVKQGVASVQIRAAILIANFQIF